MARQKTVSTAEQKIADAFRSGATELDLSGNKLTALPESLGQLTQLQSLKLRFNRLTALPELLFQLTQLQSLDLAFNQLSALPESLGDLTQLQSLDLTENRLTELPESLGEPHAVAVSRPHGEQTDCTSKQFWEVTTIGNSLFGM